MTKDQEIARKQYLAAKRGDLTSYAGMIGEEFSSKVDRLSQILGTVHEPSVGQYKEALLRNCIKNFVPKKYNVGTGFIVFVNESRLSEDHGGNVDLINLKEHSVSHQLDVIVFDDSNYSPIFRDGDFVLVRPEAVRAVVEVKGFLKKSEVAKCLGKFIALGRQWNKYSDYCERWGREKLHTPAIQLMAWNLYVDKDGKSDCDGGTLRKQIIKEYRENLSDSELEWNNFPKIHGIYLYNDCCVTACGYSSENGQGNGYSTNRGKFIRYDENREPHEDRDATVASLLASIHIHLDAPFNPDFSYFDQSIQTDIFPHPYQGITDWVTGKDVQM